MTLEEAQIFLETKRPSRGRPPKEWTLQKIEAEKVVRAAIKEANAKEANAIVQEIKQSSTKPIEDSFESDNQVMTKVRDSDVAEAFDALVALEVEW